MYFYSNKSQEETPLEKAVYRCYEISILDGLNKATQDELAEFMELMDKYNLKYHSYSKKVYQISLSEIYNKPTVSDVMKKYSDRKEISPFDENIVKEILGEDIVDYMNNFNN